MRKYIQYVFVLILCVGCSAEKLVFDIQRKEPLEIRRSASYNPRITVLVDNCKIEDLRELIPENISYCWDDSLNEKTINIDVENVTLDEFFVAVSKSAGVHISKIGDVWFFGGAVNDKESRGAMRQEVGYNFVFDLSGFSVEEVKEMFAGVGGQIRNVKSSSFIFSGSIDQIVQAKKLYDDVKSLKPSEYHFDLYIVSSELLQKYGVIGQIDEDLMMTLKMGRGLSDYQWSLIFSAVQNCSLKRNSTNTYRYVSGVFREGKEFMYTLGDKIPVVKKTVLENGTVTESGVEYLSIGLNLNISCLGSQIGLFDLKLTMNEASSYIEGYPVQHGSSFDTTLYIRDDRFRFIGHVEYSTQSTDLFGMVNNVSTWYLFLRCRRMGEGEFFFVNEDEIKRISNKETKSKSN